MGRAVGAELLPSGGGCWSSSARRRRGDGGLKSGLKLDLLAFRGNKKTFGFLTSELKNRA